MCTFDGPDCKHIDGLCMCERFLLIFYGVDKLVGPEPGVCQLKHELLDGVNFKQPWEE